MLEEEKPDYLTVAFDLPAPTFRHEMYDAYKGTRKPMPSELREQVPVMKDVLKLWVLQLSARKGTKQMISTGSCWQSEAKQKAWMSPCYPEIRDLLQLATDHICIRIPKTKARKITIDSYFAKDVQEKYQLSPLQIIELKALMEILRDNIPDFRGWERKPPQSFC